MSHSAPYLHRAPVPAEPAGHGRGPDGRPAAGNAELQRLLHLGAVRAKLTVGAAADPLEAEADAVADRIMRTPADPCSCGGTCDECSSGGGEVIRRTSEDPCSCGGTCDECSSGGGEAVIQRKPAGRRSGHPPAVPDGFVRSLGPGRPLDGSSRAFFEPRFGRDLGAVRLHTGPDAASAATSIGARAFTAGAHIALRDPTAAHSDAGRRLLAHELAHVVQQGGRRTTAIQRVGMEDPAFGKFPAERELIERERAAEAARQAKHREWEASHAVGSAKYLKTVSGGSIGRDIETTKDQIIEQRMAMFGELGREPAAKPDPFAGFGAKFPGAPLIGRTRIPPELATRYALAHQEVVVVEALLSGNQFTPEAAATARATFLDFFQSLQSVVEAEDRREFEQYQMFQAFEKPPVPTVHCPGSCHMPNPPSRPGRQPPDPAGPRVKTAIDVTTSAKNEGDWRQVIQRFKSATAILDTILLSSVRADSPAREGFLYARGLLERQEELRTRYPHAYRIPAVFYPEDKWVDVPGPEGKKHQVANGIPWYFYLTHTETSNDYRYPPGFKWTLQDITSPKRPMVSYEVDSVESFVREYNHLHVLEPPSALFKKLNNELIFPEGMLYWTYPTNAPGQLRTTEPWSVSRWLGAIGIGIAALGLILATGGLATPGVLAGLGIVGAGFGIASTLTELQEKAELGILTAEDRNKAILFIAADLASALTAGLGGAAAKATRAAAAAGQVTRVTVLIQRTATAASAVDKLLGGAVMVTVTADFVNQYQSIQNSNLSGPEKEKALQRLALTGLLTGTLMVGGHALGARGGKGEPPAGAAGRAEPTGVRPPHAEGEVITVKGHTTEPAAGWSKPKQETEFLDWSRQQETLKPDQAAREFEIAQREGERRAIPNEWEYSETIKLGDHTWSRRRDGKGWCRTSKKVCYPNATLKIGVEGQGERVSPMTTVTEVREFLEKELAKRPASVTSEQGRLDWADYAFYARRRLTNIAEALAAGKPPPPPPRTFASFLEAHPPGSPVRNEIRGSRFEKKVLGVFEDVVAPERMELVKPQHHVSESTAPGVGKGELTRPDVMFPSSEVKGWTVVTDKSRSSLVDATPTTARSRVRADFEEAVEKYAGVRQVRRTGEEVDITRVWLMYDAAGVPERLRPVIKSEARAFQRQYKDTKIVFEVFFV